MDSESQKPHRRCVGIADQKVFARTYKIEHKVKPKHQHKGEKFYNVPDCLESFLTIWKVSGDPGKFPDSLESFLTVWKVSKQCQKFPAMCPLINMACKQKFMHIYVTKNYLHFCCKNDLCALSGKFLRMIFCQTESFDFLCLWFPGVDTP